MGREKGFGAQHWRWTLFTHPLIDFVPLQAKRDAEADLEKRLSEQASYLKAELDKKCEGKTEDTGGVMVISRCHCFCWTT